MIPRPRVPVLAKANCRFSFPFSLFPFEHWPQSVALHSYFAVCTLIIWPPTEIQVKNVSPMMKTQQQPQKQKPKNQQNRGEKGREKMGRKIEEEKVAALLSGRNLSLFRAAV